MNMQKVLTALAVLGLIFGSWLPAKAQDYSWPGYEIVYDIVQLEENGPNLIFIRYTGFGMNPADLASFMSSEPIQLADFGSPCVLDGEQKANCRVEKDPVNGRYFAGVFVPVSPEGNLIFVQLTWADTRMLEVPFEIGNEESTPEATEDATAEPTEESTPEPTQEATAEPTQETTSEPTEEATLEPTEETTPEPTTPEATEEATAETTEEWVNDPVETPDVTPTVVVTWTMAPPIQITETPTTEVTPEPQPGKGPELPTGTPTPAPTEAPTEEPTEEPTTELPVEGTPIVVTPQPPTAGETTKQPPKKFVLVLPALFR